MRGKRAKSIRKIIYQGADFRKRTYTARWPKRWYQTGGLLSRGYVWGQWFMSWTVFANKERRIYQRFKHAFTRDSL